MIYQVSLAEIVIYYPVNLSHFLMYNLLMKKFLLILFLIILCTPYALSDAFVPDFKSMKNLRCDFTEVIYEDDGTVVSKNKQFRIYKIDDEYNRLFDEKEPVDKVSYYGTDKIKFSVDSVNDMSTTSTDVEIDRTNGTYSAFSDITYDNVFFGHRTSKSAGVCKFLD